MTLNQFFNIPLVKLGIHLILVVGFWVNMWNLYRIWDLDKEIRGQRINLEIIQQENADARNQSDYYTSDLYKEKYAKQENYKKRGEEVIDTSVLEPSTDQGVGNYINAESIERRSNVEKWWDFVFGTRLES